MNTLDVSSPRARRLLLTLAGVLLTVGLIAWTIAPRQAAGMPSISDAGIIEPFVNVIEIGTFLPGIALPILFFYVLAITAPFRDFVTHAQLVVRDRKLFAGFLLLMLLSLAWFFGQRNWPIELLLLPVILSGIVGGWSVGLGTGILAWLALGVWELALGGLLDVYRDMLPALYREQGYAAVLLTLRVDFRWLFLGAGKLIFIWTGGAASMAAHWLGSRRLWPGIGLFVGGAIAYLALAIPTLGHEIPGLIAPTLLALAITIGIGVAIALLIARNVQATVAMRLAQAAEVDRIQAELLALRAQINPHFFFNALNTIRYFVRSDPKTARGLLLDLSELFQRVLRSGEFVQLRDELSYVDAYLNLEQARLGERLQVERFVAAEQLLDMPIPTLTLQPLIENAVVHGIAKKREGGAIRLTVEQVGDDIQISVNDNGVGIEAGRLSHILSLDKPSASIGLRNVDARLRSIYGGAYGLHISSVEGAGTNVIVRLPLAQAEEMNLLA